MTFSLTFVTRHRYGQQQGITVPVLLRANGKRVHFSAKLDTGAQYCIFNRQYGELIGLSIEDGEHKVFSTVAGSFNTYGHTVTISTFSHDFEIMAYFSEDPNFSRNVLGREDWLRQIRLGIVHYDALLYLSHYNDSGGFLV